MNTEQLPRQDRGRSLFRHVTRTDSIIVFCFALLTFVYCLGRYGYDAIHSHSALLSSDGANIASFAAALDYPDLFEGDEVLGNPRNFAFYATVQVPLTRSLARVTGNYGTAFATLYPLAVFLQLLGFYILGRILFGRRYWATLLAIITMMPFVLSLGEIWGIYKDPIPRVLFQALLPYLLAAVLVWGAKPAAWPWLMGAAGLLVYVHAVSTPAWGVAIFLGLFAFQPPSQSVRRRIGWMLLSGAGFVAVILPFTLHYLNTYAHGTTQNYNQVHEIMTIRFATGYMDIPTAFKNFILDMCSERVMPYSAWAVVAGVPAVLWLRRDDRKPLYLIGLWLIGLLVVSVAVSWIDHAVAHAYSRTPLQVDLIRGIRYLIPFMLLFCLWPLVELCRAYPETTLGLVAEKYKPTNFLINIPGRLRAIRIPTVMAVLGLALVAGWTWRNQPTEIRHALSCWSQGKFVCSWPVYSEVIDAMGAIRRLTPPGSRLLAPPAAQLHIRYYALRPVIYSGKDGGALAYANPAELLKWYEKYKEMNEIEKLQDPEAKLTALISFAQKYNAQYILTDLPANSANVSETDVIYRGNAYTLLKVRPAPVGYGAKQDAAPCP